LRWRATRVELGESQVSLAAKRLADIRADADSLKEERKDSALKMAGGATGWGLGSWAAWAGWKRRASGAVAKKAQEAERVLASRMQLLIEANRKRELLENLEGTERARWQREFGRELEAFASEAFLGRLQSKSGRARSSGG